VQAIFRRVSLRQKGKQKNVASLPYFLCHAVYVITWYVQVLATMAAWFTN